MVLTLIIGVVCLLVGGFGGYQWGAAVERKAAAALNSAGSFIGQAAKKL